MAVEDGTLAAASVAEPDAWSCAAVAVPLTETDVEACSAAGTAPGPDAAVADVASELDAESVPDAAIDAVAEAEADSETELIPCIKSALAVFPDCSGGYDPYDHGYGRGFAAGRGPSGSSRGAG